MTAHNQHLWLCAIATIVGFTIGTLTSDSSGLSGESRDSIETQEQSPRLQSNIPTRVTEESHPNPSSKQSQDRDTQKEHERYLHERMLAEWVKREAITRDREYSQILARLGLTPDESTHVTSNLTVLHSKAIAAGLPLEDLAISRAKFDQEMKLMLGDNYEEYRRFEEMKPAIRELELITQFAWEQKNSAIAPEYEHEILELISESSATTTETWHNPYDPLPRPIAGTEGLKQFREEQFLSLQESTSSVFANLQNSSLDAHHKQLLADYYTSRLSDAERAYAKNFKSDEELARERSERIRRALSDTRERARLPASP